MSLRLGRALFLVLLLHELATAQFVAVPILVEGDPLAGQAATVQGVGRPAVSPSGLIAVEGDDSNSLLDDWVWVGGSLQISAGTSLAGTAGILDNVDAFDSTRPVNAAGMVAWSGDLDGVPITSDQVLASDSQVLLTEGDLSPISGRTYQSFSFVSIDDLGRVYCEADLAGATSADEILLRHDGSSGAGTPGQVISMNSSSVFREGETIIGGPLHGQTWDNGAFNDLRANGVGTILVEGDLETTGVGLASSLDNEVLVRKQPGLVYELLLREGVTQIQTLVTGLVPLQAIHELDLADNNDWAIRGSVDDSVTSLEFNDIALAEFGGLGRFVVAQEGMNLSSVLGQPGAILGAIQGISLNSSQQVLVLANVESRVAPLPYDEALFLYENGTLSLVFADEITTVSAPGDPRLTDFLTDHATLGENGRIVFAAKAEVGGFLREGVFEAVLPPVYPVENFDCFVTPGFPSVTATWTNPAATPYDGIRVFVDGTLATTLAGAETAFETPPISPVNVPVLVEVEPFIGSDLANRRDCTVFVTHPLDISECRSPGSSISDFTTLTDTVTVTSALTAREVTLSLTIVHTAVGDLDIEVTSPAGTTVVLTTDNGGSADDLNATFADFGNPLNGTPLDAGLALAPEGPGTFEDFRCAPVAGDWTLTVTDDGSGDQGTWVEWCVNITEETAPAANCCPLPSALLAVNGGSCSTGAIELSWENHGPYSTLELARDDGGNTVTVLPVPGNATSFSDATAIAGVTYTYTLRARCQTGGLLFPAASASVTVDAGAQPTITDLAATSDFCADSVTLTWNDLGISFASVELSRNGTFLADVTGTESFVDLSPPSGVVEYVLEASCPGSITTTSLLLEHELEPPIDLTCSPPSMSCDGVVTLTWTNPATYSSLELRIDGLAPTASLAPGDTSFVTTPLDSGPHTFEWFAECNGTTATSSCTATVTLPSSGESDVILALEGTRTGGNRGAIDSASALATALTANGRSVYVTAPANGGDLLTGLPCGVDLTAFDRLWVMLGTFPNDYRLTSAEGDYLALLSRDFEMPIYLESGDHWGFQPTASALDARDGIEPNAAPSVILDGDDTFTAMAAQPVAGFDLVSAFPAPMVYGQDNPNGPDYNDRLTLGGDTPGVPIDSEVLSVSALWRNSPDGLPDASDPDENLPYITAARTIPTIGAPLIVQTWEFGGFDRDPAAPAASNPQRATLAALYLAALGGPPPPTTSWYRGDTNDDGAVNIADATYLLNALFPGGLYTSTLTCLDAADTNADLGLDLADAITILEALFLPGALPIATPNFAGGCTAVPPDLGCNTFTHCP